MTYSLLTKRPVPSLRDYDINSKRGFLPEHDPLLSLQHPYNCWDDAARQLPDYILAGCARRQLNKLPLLHATNLTTDAELQRAYSLLSFLNHTYVWCEGELNPCHVLPANLAVPWMEVSKSLGCKPILTHSSVVMYNWRRLDAEGPLDLTNLAALNTFNGCMDEAWFYLVTVAIEALGGPALEAITDAMQAVNNLNAMIVAERMNTLADRIDQMTEIIVRMFEKCDAKVYYDDVRPYFGGWRGNPVLPNGMVYEGVSETPFYFAGGSAGQSSLIQSIDIALGVHHSPTNQCPMGADFLESPPVTDGESPSDVKQILAETPSVDSVCTYISTVREYMPRKHREFLEALMEAPSLHGFVQSPHGSADAKHGYNRAVLALENFRTKHIKIVATYIITPASKRAPSLASYRGTGGSSIMPFLKQVRSETREQLVTSNTEHS
ncbi:hypothetical protein SARC_10335 [Sphaeroforma arctica JP610]|uniref:Indoleamine 2,3-dioxygenase n=1 Tax=Sphaeroforma arctica JP610 TaxID=667725 RepID=A0A0L0FKB7_9EUKA|nr:hypothetical protein SARC_10335 [Sphaeroforma arctica JP610]KNC77200.1 hypothetical protein SARC_10335 [Sphaeroforma arctica JP610]|eukprot:XP_014151102.1 hypothetical protein SARC_10335 [Sphaeroforma arctica JP610]